MKNLFFLLTLVLLVGCKKDQKRPASSPMEIIITEVPDGGTYTISIVSDKKGEQVFEIVGGTENKTYIITVDEGDNLTADYSFQTSDQKVGPGSVRFVYRESTRTVNSGEGTVRFSITS
ncbi:hypothetical protein IM792_18110 [Mucilaginibacter sp. JRF]|uniref:hypothetical protein n=1 Tax=Mucilaginibacter sp. JRF TaxID=2780088 RepID=UPI00188239EB|nr:hypothetical protein [Mucilaginibacter sp. JRF]MBE9586373.1 hypothetical protein [Mucilaginibacter sp. JRF]